MTKLSICYPVFRDFDGIYFSAGDIPLSHPEVCDDVEIVVVDNDPESASGQQTKDWVAGRLSSCIHTRYIAAPGPGGPALAKQRCVDEATGDFVLVMDSHVRVAPGGLARLLQFYADNPATNDLYSGPLVFDADFLRAGSNESLQNFTTHMEEVWRGHDLGIWATDPRGAAIDSQPFEIPAMGAGLFTCRRTAFAGFNKNVRGFGGEEFFIYRKTRKNGGQGVCLPFLRWMHRFGRPLGVPYPLRLWDKVRNYVITHQELGLSIDPIYEHFVAVHKHTLAYSELLTLGPGKATASGDVISEGDWERLANNPTFQNAVAAARAGKNDGALQIETRGGVSERDWNHLVADPIGHTEPLAAACGSCSPSHMADAVTLEQLYEKAASEPSDIVEHVPKLRELASQCDVVVEFGVRSGVSTIALLAGQPAKLESYDLNASSIATDLAKRSGKTAFRLSVADVTQVDIPVCDLLFEDARHTALHIDAILMKHAAKVRRWIAFHDTQIFGETGEDGGPGILPALRKFLKEHKEWSVVYHTQKNHGFTVIGKLAKDKPPLPPLPKMVMTYAKSLAFHTLKGSPIADQSVIDERESQCAICDQRTTEAKDDAVYNRCAICGCYLDEGPSQREGKLLWADSVCPIGRW